MTRSGRGKGSFRGGCEDCVRYESVGAGGAGGSGGTELRSWRGPLKGAETCPFKLAACAPAGPAAAKAMGSNGNEGKPLSMGGAGRSGSCPPKFMIGGGGRGGRKFIGLFISFHEDEFHEGALGSSGNCIGGLGMFWEKNGCGRPRLLVGPVAGG